MRERLPSRKLTYPTLGKGKSSSKVPFLGDMLVPRRVYINKSLTSLLIVTVIRFFDLETACFASPMVSCLLHEKAPLKKGESCITYISQPWTNSGWWLDMIKRYIYIYTHMYLFFDWHMDGFYIYQFSLFLYQKDIYCVGSYELPLGAHLCRIYLSGKETHCSNHFEKSMVNCFSGVTFLSNLIHLKDTSGMSSHAKKAFFLGGEHVSETWFSFNLIPTEFIRWSHAAPILQNPSLPNQSARAQEADQSPSFHPYLNDGLCWSSGIASCSSLIKWWLRKLQISRTAGNTHRSRRKNHGNMSWKKQMKLGRHGWTWDMGLFDKKCFII